MVYRSYPLSIPNPSIVRAIIVIHGASRTADSYFRYVLDSARATGHLDDTLIVSPSLAEASATLLSDRWGDDWKEGGNSRVSGASSFEVIDRLYERITSTFQSVQTLVVAGHSAGGQFVHRYAAAGQGPSTASAVSSRFLVLNSSSYLYLDDRRLFRDNFESFENPQQNRALISALRRLCPGYNRYKYGLEEVNEYSQRVGVSSMILQLTSRNVSYLAGSIDVRTDNNLDDDCAAQLQGHNRLSRWGIYAGYVETSSQQRWRANSGFQLVPGVGHSARAMLNSTEARAVLFS